MVLTVKLTVKLVKKIPLIVSLNQGSSFILNQFIRAAYNPIMIAARCHFLNAAVWLFSPRFVLRAFLPPSLAFLSVGDRRNSQVFVLSWDAPAPACVP